MKMEKGRRTTTVKPRQRKGPKWPHIMGSRLGPLLLSLSESFLIRGFGTPAAIALRVASPSIPAWSLGAL